MAGRTIVVTSGKGGVGKTTTVANIGTVLAKKKHSVVMIDADIGAVRLVDLGDVPGLIARGEISHALVVGAFYFFEQYRKTHPLSQQAPPG